jgi:hypothetical protein
MIKFSVTIEGDDVPGCSALLDALCLSNYLSPNVVYEVLCEPLRIVVYCTTFNRQTYETFAAVKRFKTKLIEEVK